MYKVFLVDDEPLIVEGLKKIVPWEKYNCKVIDTASDGVEALEKINILKPDILFTDIRMPNKDGLKLIASLKSNHPNLQITVLTAHRDFEYAQTAINFGVSRYLLKPSKMDELVEALKIMTENLNHKKDNLTENNNSQNEAGSFIVNEALKFMNSNYFEKLTLEDVSNEVFVSKWHLSKLLNEHTNQSFLDNLNQIRIEKAKELLNDLSLKILDISLMVGFNDSSHFSKTFKKITKISANEYRNTLN